MISYDRSGNLLEAETDALVNTVNTVGVMGKGIALQFKKKFPENFKAYRRAYEKDELETGRMFTFETGKLSPRYIINFPTKRHWRGDSRLEYIREGMEDLIRIVDELGIESIALPPLGCGNGGLDWETEVRPLVEEAFSRRPEVHVIAFEPSGERDRVKLEPGEKKPELTPARAVMISLIGAYKVAHYSLGRVAAQKLAYLVQSAGEESLKLDFEKDKFGPYAENLNFLLQTLDGHYVEGYGDRSGSSDIHLLPGALEEADVFLKDHPETQRHLERTARLIEEFETPYGVELLASVHWSAAEESARSCKEATDSVRNWTARKGNLFNERHICIAWGRLEAEGWLPANRSKAVKL